VHSVSSLAYVNQPVPGLGAAQAEATRSASGEIGEIEDGERNNVESSSSDKSMTLISHDRAAADRPLISVIIPAVDEAATLGATLRAIGPRRCLSKLS
jgi:hypothetical protein